MNVKLCGLEQNKRNEIQFLRHTEKTKSYEREHNRNEIQIPTRHLPGIN